MTLGIGQNIFHGLDRVLASDLYKPDILDTIYLRLFKHMMDWIEAFLKKHGRLQAFDEVWKALPPYPGFLVPKKAYREVTQWQGKETRNLERCILGVLAVALRQPRGAQAIPFKRALRCVRALVDFNMMAQYRSHTPDTIAYMEDYLYQFHRMKDISLEFRVTQRTQAKVDKQRKEIRPPRALIRERVHQQKTKHTHGCNPCSLCVRRSRHIERKLAFWVCGLLLGACGQGSMPPRRTRRNQGLRRYPPQKGSPDAKRFSGRNPIG